MSRIRALQLLAPIVFGVAGIAPLDRAAGWSDDFSDNNVTDGNPVTWSQNLLEFFPGSYSATGGNYELSAFGDPNGDGNAANEQLVTWVDSVDFTDTYLRAQGTILPGTLPDETGGNLALLGRLNTTTVSAYVLYIDAGGQLGLQISLGGQISDLVPNVDLPELAATSDVIIELDIVGDQLSGFAWRPGEPKPQLPQIMATDPTFASGPAGIAYDEDDDNTTGVFRFVAAQSTPFVDSLPGDFNGNGAVDIADFVLWRDGPANPLDYELWRWNYGASLGAGALTAGGNFAAAVPEPASLILALLFAAVSATIVRRRT